MKSSKRCWGIPLLMAALGMVAQAAEKGVNDNPRLNVLLLMADDLAVTLGCYGHPQAQTPHLDALARRAVLFERAYCQFPHCNPSRASLFSGLRPRDTGVSDNDDNLYANLPGVVTLPRHFRDHGYATARCGKIFHLGVPTGLESMDDPLAWEVGTPFRDERPYPNSRASTVRVPTGKGQGLKWQEIAGSDDDLVDGQFAKAAVEWLEQRDPARPFFLAVGFHRPHLPLVAPEQYYDLYPLENISLPAEPDLAEDEADLPWPARNGAVPGYALSATPDQRRAAIRAYLATVSYMDAQAGRVLSALKRLGLEEHTIVIFTSDHGWHLGEHGLWHKRSLFEESARVPLLIAMPGAKGSGTRSSSLVELLDLYPTLCDAAALPWPAGAGPDQGLRLQGLSLRAVLEDPKTEVHRGAFTAARRGMNAEHWGRSVRTSRWRYTEWDEGRSGIELYDHDTDPGEFTNLANDPRFADELDHLRGMLARE